MRIICIKKKRLSKGFSLIEVILAVAIFMLFSTAAVGVVLQGFNLNRLGSEETVANQFAAEGIEAVKSIKNQAYSNLNAVNPTPRAVRRNASNVWEFNPTDGSNDTLIHNASDNYVRQVKAESVNRDGSGNIVETGGTLDPDTKKITSTVSWNFNSARPESVILTTYLSDWRRPLGGPIMMAYSKTTTTPFYRTWDGSSWSAEGSAQVVGGNINYIVVKSARTRNEAILGTLDSNGFIYIQIWNGTSWGNLTQVVSIGSANATTRSFDIEYEKSSDRAVIAYLSSPSSSDFTYRIWDGSTLSEATTITAPPTTGVINWIELAASPISTSNEIAMIMLDANSDVYAMVWNGSSWGTMGVSTVWDATGATSVRKSIDVAYEQISGRAMFIWGDSIATDQYYRIWDDSTLTAATLLDIRASSGVANWIRLVSRPSSNELLYGVQDGDRRLNTRKWSGSTWDTAAQHPRHDGSTENTTSMNFDLVWETHPANPGKAWLMWGNGGRVSKKQWSGTAWRGASILTGSDDTSFIRLKADSTSGSIFAGIYEDASAAGANRNIWESRLTGGGAIWSAKNIIWSGPTSATPVYFRIDIATP